MRGWLAVLGVVWASVATAGVLDDVTRFQDYEARRSSSSNEDLTKNGDARGMKQGEALTIFEAEGPGVVTHIWCTIAAYDPFQGRSVVLRVYYDGAEEPSVVSPLGDFFGVGHGAWKDVDSIPVVVKSYGRSRTCYWRMPFRKSIRITVTNESKAYEVDSFYYYVDWQKHENLPEDTAYFHAKYSQEFPAKPGNYTILETQGRGHYVGTVYSVQQMESGWFGEGDDFFYIDGAEEPQLRGTGTEDYFNDAWGFREFCAPYFGVSLYEGVIAGDRVTAYRWHLPDPVPFKDSLKVTMEHRGSIFNDQGNILSFDLGSFVERPDWVSSVAFWYQYPPATFSEALPPAEERIAPYRVIYASELEYRADPPFMVMPQEPFLVYIPSKPGGVLELDFDVEEAGRYVISGIFLHGILGGTWQAALDGEDIGGPLDYVQGQYDPAFVSLDTHDLKAGTHTLKFTNIDTPSPGLRAVMPKMYGFGAAALTLLRLEDMEGYFEKKHELMKQ